MLGRAWNFVKRHKKKVIFGTVVAGGVYYGRKLYLRYKPIIQLLRNPDDPEGALKELLGADEGALKELFAGMAAAGGEDKNKSKAARFEHKQKVSDACVQKSLTVLKEQVQDSFCITDLHAQLRKAADKQEKDKVFKRLQA